MFKAYQSLVNHHEAPSAATLQPKAEYFAQRRKGRKGKTIPDLAPWRE
jgi:hypothetical protein